MVAKPRCYSILFTWWPQNISTLDLFVWVENGLLFAHTRTDMHVCSFGRHTYAAQIYDEILYPRSRYALSLCGDDVYNLQCTNGPVPSTTTSVKQGTNMLEWPSTRKPFLHFHDCSTNYLSEILTPTRLLHQLIGRWSRRLVGGRKNNEKRNELMKGLHPWDRNNSVCDYFHF